ncbi:MAG: ribonuclease HI family protein, partial [Thermoplasmata archaeon]
DVPDLVGAKGAMRSNNIAEYTALILLLNRLPEGEAKAGPRERYLICGDSQLVIRQMRGEYRVKQPHLQRLHAQATQLSTGLDLEFQWIPREKNRAGFLLEGRNPKGSEATREN